MIEQVRRLAGKVSRGGAERDQSGPLGPRSREYECGWRDLVRRLLDETAVERLRLSSVEPMDFSDELLELMAGSARIAKHVHAPLQSGSDRCCGGCTASTARGTMPDESEGSRADAGVRGGSRRHDRLPGRDRRGVRGVRAFIESLPFTYLHVFTYSERPGTPAAESSAQVPLRCVSTGREFCGIWRRARIGSFGASMVGETISAVTLENGCDALSGNYLKIALAANARGEPDRRGADRRADSGRVSEAGALRVL